MKVSRWRTTAGLLVAVGLALGTAAWWYVFRYTAAALPLVLLVMTPLPALLACWVARSLHLLVGLTWSTSLTVLWAADNYRFYATHNGLDLWWQTLWGYGIVWVFLSLQSLCGSIPLMLAHRKRSNEGKSGSRSRVEGNKRTDNPTAASR
jgi:hypothetical protein